MYKLFNFLSVFLISTFVSLILVESFMWLADIEVESPLFQTKYSPRYHHLDIDAEITLNQINSNYFDNQLQKILIIGDSFIEGAQVEESKRSTNILSRKLEELYPNTYQVITLGQGSWSMLSYSRAVEDILKFIRPQKIIIAIDQCDAIDDEFYAKEINGDLDGPFVNTLIHRLEQDRDKSFFHKSRVISLIDLVILEFTKHSILYPWLSDELFTRHFDKLNLQVAFAQKPEAYGQYFELTKKLMKRIDSILPEESTVYFVTYPRSENLAGQKKSTFVNDQISEDHHSIPYVDFWVEKSGIAHELKKSKIVLTLDAFKTAKGEEDLFFWQDDVHWTPRGHEVFAEQLLKIILQ